MKKKELPGFDEASSIPPQLLTAAAIAGGPAMVQNLIAAATPGGIEAQEARGQKQLVSSFTRLPKDMDLETAKRVGFKILEPADDIFMTVEAPTGWELRPTDHSMWSEIFDDQGRKRGSVFYKAAFYDRSAHGNLISRYQIHSEYNEDHKVKNFKAVDTANKDEIIAFVEVPEDADYKAKDALRNKLIEHLTEMFPDWNSVEAYW